MKAYSISFDPSRILAQELLNYLDSYPAIICNWYTPFMGTIYIVSDNSLVDLANFIAAKFSFQNFMLSEVSAWNTNGRMPENVWQFINNPKSSGRWEGLLKLADLGASATNALGSGSIGPLGEINDLFNNKSPSTSTKTLADLLYNTLNKK